MSSPVPDARHAPAPLIGAWMPRADVSLRHAVTVRAPAHVVFHVASTFDIESLPLVRALIRLRGWLMGATAAPAHISRGLVEEMAALGWTQLAVRERREIVAGAAVQPWQPDVTFRPIPADQFADFREPGWVRIAWSLEAEPLGPSISRLQSQTRVCATDDSARRRFRGYWRKAGPGIVLIRWVLLRAVRREAERRWRLTDRAVRAVRAVGIHGREAFT